MRKFSYAAPVVKLQLSAEEEAIQIDESNQSAHELEQTSADIDRLGDIVVTVNEVQTVVSNTPEIQPIDAALTGAVGEMAVAGTDIAPDDIIEEMLPSENVSTESFVAAAKEKLAAMWKAIKEFFAKMWKHVKDFFGVGKKKAEKLEEKQKKTDESYAHLKGLGIHNENDYNAFVREVEKAIDADAKKADKIPTFHFYNQNSKLCLGDSTKPLPPRQLVVELQHLLKEGEHMYKSFCDGVLKLLDYLANTVEQCLKDPERAGDTYKDMREGYQKIADKLFLDLKFHNGTTPGPLLGDLHLAVMSYTPGEERGTMWSPRIHLPFTMGGGADEIQEPVMLSDGVKLSENVHAWIRLTKGFFGQEMVEKIQQKSQKVESLIEQLIKHRPTDAELRGEHVGKDEDPIVKYAAGVSKFGIDIAIERLAYESKELVTMGVTAAVKLPQRIHQIFEVAADYAEASSMYLLKHGIVGDAAEADFQNKLK